MTMIVETGAGVRGANSYTSVSYVTDYLTSRNRQTENGWSTLPTNQKEAAIIEATDYVQLRFGQRFKGKPQFSFPFISSTAEFIFTLIEEDDELLIGDQRYTFVLSLSKAFDVLLGSTVEESVLNLVNTINNGFVENPATHSATPPNRYATAECVGVTMLLTATVGGSSTVETPLSTTTTATFTPFAGGMDGGPQNLHFPAAHAFDQNGIPIIGVPDILKQAIAEYSVRAAGGTLLPDPEADPYGGSLYSRSEQVGPIKEEVRYSRSSESQRLFVSYPAADRLLRPLLLGSRGSVIRG